MADDVNDMGRNIARGIIPFGSSKKPEQIDNLLQYLQQALGINQPQPNNQQPPQNNELARRAYIEMMMKQAAANQQGGQSQAAGVPMDRQPTEKPQRGK